MTELFIAFNKAIVLVRKCAIFLYYDVTHNFEKESYIVITMFDIKCEKKTVIVSRMFKTLYEMFGMFKSDFHFLTFLHFFRSF